MHASPLPLDADQLFAHQAFVRAVARGLVRDAHVADDVAQDTLLRALRRGPAALAALPAWLARTARNRVLELRRADARRTRREAAVGARGGALVGEHVHATCERLEVQRDLIAAVLALEEPFRSVVLLRHYHGLEPAEIATRLGAKAATVRTWLVRAHDRLREQLDRQRPRDEWLAVLLPVGLRDGPAVPASATALTLLGITGAAAALAIWLATNGGAPVAAPPPARIAAASPSAAAPVAPPETVRIAALVGGGVAQDPLLPRVPEVPAEPAVLSNVRGAAQADTSFSFERNYGGVERRGKDRARSDYDVRLTGGQLRVDTVTDDRSLIVDLGDQRLGLLGLHASGKLEGLVRAAAVARYENADPKAATVMLPAQLGHCYFVWTDDSDSDTAALFEITELGERCVLAWHATEDGAFGRGSVLSPDGGVQLSAVALRLRAAALEVRTDADAPLQLKQPRVVLQARAGAVGGNPCRIELGRGRTPYFDRIVGREIPFGVPATIADDSIGFCEGGRIPEDQILVITRASWRGEAIGDSNGDGCLHVRLGDTDLVKVEKTDGVVADTWQGRVEIRPGQEDRVFLEISNSSRGEVVFEGHFETRHR